MTQIYNSFNMKFFSLLFLIFTSTVFSHSNSTYTFVLSHKNLITGNSSPEGSIAQAIKTELSSDVISLLNTLVIPDDINHNEIEKLFSKNATTIATINVPNGYIQHFIIDKIVYSLDGKEALIRVACIFLPSISFAIQPTFSEFSPIAYTRYYSLILVDSEWKISLRATESVIQQLLNNDTYARRFFFFLHDSNIPAEGDALLEVVSNIKQLIANVAAFAQSKFWSSFEIFCEPQPIISLEITDDTPESAVVQYMKYQKQGDIDSVNKLLVEIAKEKNEKFLKEVGKEKAVKFMKKVYDKFGDSFTLFVKGKPADWPENTSLISLAGIGLTDQWQVSSFTVTQPNNIGRFLLFPNFEDASVRLAINQKYQEILPLWVSELNFKKCILHLPL